MRFQHLPNRARVFALGLAVVVGLAAAPHNSTPEAPPPSTPREFYNAGTQLLSSGKLREAEAFLESALASQLPWLQPPALYNLGHVRFRQGTEELKKGPSAGAVYRGGAAVGQVGQSTIGTVDEALAGTDIQQMVAAYLRGRGVHRELRAALSVVRKAMERYGGALAKWQRASGDFRSAVELNGTDSDARTNADIVDRSIARLVDSIHQLQMMAQALAQQEQELRQKLKQLRGRIPDKDMPPGAAGDDDEDEDQPNGPREGQKEGPGKEGKELRLTPDQAGWILQTFRLDNERRLPMNQEQAGEPQPHSGKTW